MRDSVEQPDAKPPHVLGVDFGSAGATSKQFADATREVERVHDAIAQLDDVAAELVLTRACESVCKVVHLLRAAGAEVEEKDEAPSSTAQSRARAAAADAGDETGVKYGIAADSAFALRPGAGGDDDPANDANAADAAWQMNEGSICGLGQAAPLPLTSALKYFPEAFEEETPSEG